VSQRSGQSPACLPALSDLPGAGRIVVAFSGGPDSVCLAALLANAGVDRPIECVHVDHGLDSGSRKRAEIATAIAAKLELPCRVETVEVDRKSGIEAGARKARYAVLTELIESGDVLVTAHHADDQAETVLMRLIRGSGPAGLAGIPRLRRFAKGWLARPLLDWRRDEIRAWLERHNLEWVEDPANRDLAMDRNYIANELMPAILRRWPGAIDSILRSARLSEGARNVLAEATLADFMRFSAPGRRIERDALNRLDDFRFSEMIRHWCHHLGHSSPPPGQLEEFMNQLQTAAADRQPELRWAESVMRAHDQWIWLEPLDRIPENWSQQWSGRVRLDLPGRLGALTLEPPPATDDLVFHVKLGRPGETIQLDNRNRPVSVRKLMHAAGILPWHRDLWPRLWQGDRLVAVGDQWLDRDFKAQLDGLNTGLEWHTTLVKSTHEQKGSSGTA
jgi:tRNA(Ile)-lysidine synthase